jgi:hypothetical protein
MKAYVGLVQQREREIGCDVLTHQKVSGVRPSSLRQSLTRSPSTFSGPAPTTPTICSRPSPAVSPRPALWVQELRKVNLSTKCLFLA